MSEPTKEQIEEIAREVDWSGSFSLEDFSQIATQAKEGARQTENTTLNKRLRVPFYALFASMLTGDRGGVPFPSLSLNQSLSSYE